MLDQNTDRMWYVIGAVLVGAAIILIANSTMPEMFASVGESMNLTTGKVTDTISSISRDRMPFDMKEITSWQGTHFEWLSDTAVKLIPNHPNLGGIRIPASRFKMGRTYTISFDMTTLSGDIHAIGGHLDIASNAIVLVDGVRQSRWYGGDINGSNDWMYGVDYPRGNNKHNVELTFTVDQESGGNNSNVFIQPNRTDFPVYVENGLEFTVLIEDIEFYEHGGD